MAESEQKIEPKQEERKDRTLQDMPKEDQGEKREQNAEAQPDRGLEWFLGNVKDCTEFLVVCWAFLMLTVFPVYVIDHYQDIGAYKFAFFSGISTLFLVPGAVLGLVYAVFKPICRRKQEREAAAVLSGGPGGGPESGLRSMWAAVRAEKRRLSWLDIGMLAYLLFNILSFLGSGFKEDAWAGVGGWNMGLRTQLLMIAAYFLLSRFFPPRRLKLIFAGAMLGSGITFVIGILHRFSIDPFGFYRGLDSDTTAFSVHHRTGNLVFQLCLHRASHRSVPVLRFRQSEGSRDFRYLLHAGLYDPGDAEQRQRLCRACCTAVRTVSGLLRFTEADGAFSGGGDSLRGLL